MNHLNWEDALRQLPGRISRVHSRTLSTAESFVVLASRFADSPGTVALVSGGSLDCARYNILGVWPWLSMKSRGMEFEMVGRFGTVATQVDPFDAFQSLLHRFELTDEERVGPLSAGFLGYLAYDLKDRLEELPSTSVDDLHLPDSYLVAPSALLVQDRHTSTTRLFVVELDGNESEAMRCLREFERALAEPLASKPASGVVATASASDEDKGRKGLVSGFTRAEYLDAVEAVRDYIVRGHVYQVNLSQRFEVPFQGDGYALFAHLFSKNPAPFFAYVNAGDHEIISTSPERFLLLEDGAVETRPIKGTRPRGRTAVEDDALRQSLQSSTKDDAEISMIVDLLRNDIGKVCRAGSVRVTEHKRTEAYENVYHLVSIVRGELDEGMDAIDLVRATFPGGSITGCPKIRSMEIIDELEPVRRHVYTGSIGYFGFGGTMDFSIAIRTATVTGGRLVFSVGGGIVYDSNPADEYEETLHKGRSIMAACTSREVEELSTFGGDARTRGLDTRGA